TAFDSASFVSAVAAAQSAGAGTVFCQKADYTLTAQMEITTSDITIEFAPGSTLTINMASQANNAAIWVHGTGLGGYTNFAGNHAAGVTTFTVGTSHGLVAGDYLEVESTATVMSSGTSFLIRPKEIFRILSVTSTTVVVEQASLFAYN